MTRMPSGTGVWTRTSAVTRVTQPVAPLKWGVLLALLITGTLAVACGSDGDGSGGPNPIAPGASGTLGAAGPKPIPASSLAALLPSASEYETAVLADGMLTLAEYEAAKLAQVQCLREAGLTVVNPHLNGIYVYRFMVAVESGFGVPPSAVGACKQQFAGVIDMVWAEVSAPMAQAIVEESRRMMAECYAQSGLSVDDRPHDSADPEVLVKHRHCEQLMQTALDIEGISFGVDGDGRPR